MIDIKSMQFSFLEIIAGGVSEIKPIQGWFAVIESFESRWWSSPGSLAHFPPFLIGQNLIKCKCTFSRLADSAASCSLLCLLITTEFCNNITRESRGSNLQYENTFIGSLFSASRLSSNDHQLLHLKNITPHSSALCSCQSQVHYADQHTKQFLG